MNHDILLRNHVKVIGNGKRQMIFAPGFGCDQSVWNFVTKAFIDEYQLILFDYVGSGNSDLTAYDENRYSTLKGYSQDILDICSTLKVKDAIFVGHSVGGMIGMLASIQQPKHFSELIMIGPSPCYLNDPPHYFGGFEEEELRGLLNLMERNYIGWANIFASTLLNDANQANVKKELEDRFCSTDPLIARQFAEATFFADNRHDLSKVLIPSLILQCSEDVIAPVQVGQYLHQHLSFSTLKQMEAIGHCPHMSHPEETIALIQDYLTERLCAQER